MRDAITAAGDPTVLLSTVRDALARGLQIELDAQALVPTVVQTLVYGQFAAWLAVDDPQHFDWMQAAYRLKVPVYAEILHETLRPALIRKCDLTGHLAAIARVLAWTDRVTFEAAFDGDAIQYFYEPSLAEFDATLRDELGSGTPRRRSPATRSPAPTTTSRPTWGFQRGWRPRRCTC